MYKNESEEIGKLFWVDGEVLMVIWWTSLTFWSVQDRLGVSQVDLNGNFESKTEDNQQSFAFKTGIWTLWKIFLIH